MSKIDKVPKFLYKYRAFSPRLLDMLVADELYYSDPSDFNDPFDCRPSLEANLSNEKLEEILLRMWDQRLTAEMQAAAETLKYRGLKTIEHIARHSQKKASQFLQEARYNATNPNIDVDNPLQQTLRQLLEEELLCRYDGGIVSFGTNAICPLMWSHYGDQHHGVCVGYSVPPDIASNIHKVAYGGSRKVLASDIELMENNEEAKLRVDNAVLLTKAGSWRYEKEWRLIGQRGVQNSHLELEEVIFGMRCKSTVKFAIIQALANRKRPVKFSEMCEQIGTFKLKKRRLDEDELFSSFLPVRYRDVFDCFDVIEETEN
ncbi:DUF2971 domain-containing protein [uncultured Thalassospira sp.]|jgi:hypothetical protein|uniref:DUF2971 domain-containing protein n=1 Tax=uncultured Thalassospira sp. TaxID=404382 RepID=UPI0030DC38F5|tara:strand:- start:608 stop:1558 length:951 start_codon:yes stop_codon:yes gene_type:complete